MILITKGHIAHVANGAKKVYTTKKLTNLRESYTSQIDLRPQAFNVNTEQQNNTTADN
jgi:hypothetical protein